MKIVFIGAVDFSYQMLKHLLQLNIDIAAVVTMKSSKFNDDYRDLSPICREYGVPIRYVTNLNDHEDVEWIKTINPTLLVCIGWSQILGREVLQSGTLGAIGYHPAKLPDNRGRHPITWALVLGLRTTSSTFFFLDEGIDSGDIISQIDIRIVESDDAASLYIKLADVARTQLTDIFTRLKENRIVRQPQSKELGNIWRRRGLTDGRIDWRMSNISIYNLIRGLAKPYVGADFIYCGQQYRVWKSEVMNEVPRNIEFGKVYSVDRGGPVIKCGEGAIKLLVVEPGLHVSPGINLK